MSVETPRPRTLRSEMHEFDGGFALGVFAAGDAADFVIHASRGPMRVDGAG